MFIIKIDFKELLKIMNGIENEHNGQVTDLFNIILVSFQSPSIRRSRYEEYFIHCETI